MAFEKYTLAQLKYKKILLMIAILGLVLMCVSIGIGLYQISLQKDSVLIFLTPTVFAPISMFPAIISAGIEKEIKRRNKEIS